MGWIFRPEDGAVNALLAKIGLGALQHNWLGSPDSALPILMFILVWIQLGYPIVIFMSGLQRVDPELYEAAGLDGANWWQKFRVVTLPSIIPELLVVILTATIGALKTFAPVYLLTKGGRAPPPRFRRTTPTTSSSRCSRWATVPQSPQR